jgi:hypothetical protein
MHYRQLIALLMVCAYLILPLDSFANLSPRLAHPHQGGSSLPTGGSVQSSSLPGDSAPAYGNALAGDNALAISLEDAISYGSALSAKDGSSAGKTGSHCPCSDRHGSDGCNPGCSCCSCCSFCAPLPAGIPLLTVQPTTSFALLDPLNYFPKVYLPIFVPPQNRG